MSAKPCPLCGGGHVVVYNDGGQRVEHYPNCTPALRSLVRVADMEERIHTVYDDHGVIVDRCDCRFCLTVRRYRKERAR